MALDWYDSELHRGITAFSKEHDWVLNTHMVRTHQIPGGWEGDGVIGLMSQPTTRAFVSSLGLPTVDMGGHFTEFPQVLSDNYQAGSLAAGHFLERNHRNFSFLFIQSSRLEKEVSSGFIQALESAGQTCRLHYWKATDFEHEINYRIVHKWAKITLASLPKPVAVMCQNDDTMAIILNAALDADLHVPEDVALLGLGNSSLVCDFLRVKLSSIDVDLRNYPLIFQTASGKCAWKPSRILSSGRDCSFRIPCRSGASSHRKAVTTEMHRISHASRHLARTPQAACQPPNKWLS